MKNINELFIKAGGPARIAVAFDLHQYTIERWRKHGVPVKYWDKLQKLYGITPAELYTIGQAIKKSKY